MQTAGGRPGGKRKDGGQFFGRVGSAVAVFEVTERDGRTKQRGGKSAGLLFLTGPHLLPDVSQHDMPDFMGKSKGQAAFGEDKVVIQNEKIAVAA